MKQSIRSLFVFGMIIALAIAAYTTGFFDWARDIDQDQIAAVIDTAGYWGPILLIVIMMLAIIATPIPSAPIAIAAGAAYGHFGGTAIVVTGAELGALVAFAIARWLGRSTVENWLGERAEAGLLGSQNALTFAVFASRLMPFVSFDLISYAAGLSTLRFWRFALATLAGIVPASFFLAHFGGAAVRNEGGLTAWLVIGIGLLTGLPLVWAAFRRT